MIYHYFYSLGVESHCFFMKNVTSFWNINGYPISLIIPIKDGFLTEIPSRQNSLSLVKNFFKNSSKKIQLTNTKKWKLKNFNSYIYIYQYHKIISLDLSCSSISRSSIYLKNNLVLIWKRLLLLHYYLSLFKFFFCVKLSLACLKKIDHVSNIIQICIELG